MKNPSQSTRDSLIAHISLRSWNIISAYEDTYTVKPALQALRHFLSKSLVRAQDLVLAVSNKQLPDTDGQLKSYGHNDSSTSLAFLSVSQCYAYSHDFFCKTLSWVRYPDTAPITGRLVSAFCHSLRIWSSGWHRPITPEHTRHNDQLIWLPSLRSFVRLYPDLLDLIAVHVVPEIVRQDHEEIGKYTQSLHDLTASSPMDYCSLDLQLDLLLIRSVLEFGSHSSLGK